MSSQTVNIPRDTTLQDTNSKLQAIAEIIGGNPMIAEKFSTESSYAAGEYCINDGEFEKFTAAKTAGAWDASKATETTVGEELTALNSTLVKKPSVNINNIITSGVDIVLITGTPTFTSGVTDIDISSYLPSGKKFSAVAFAVFQTAATISVKSCVVSTTTLTIKCDSSFSGSTAISAMLFTMPNT